MTRNSTENQPAPIKTIRLRLQKPSLYRVILHNDDYTTMDFVVSILIDVFQKSPDDATLIMYTIHENGLGLCGVYPREIAEYKVTRTTELAHQAGFPLLCTMEKE